MPLFGPVRICVIAGPTVVDLAPSSSAHAPIRLPHQSGMPSAPYAMSLPPARRAWPLRSGDGPLSVRVRPSSIKRDCARRATSTGGKVAVNVHAKSRLTLEPLRTLRSENKGQAGACPDRTRAIPCTVRVGSIGGPATGDSNSSDHWQAQRPATADNTHDPRQLGICPARKQTVEDRRHPAATVANTAAKPLDGARRTWTTLEYRPSPQPVTDGPGRLAHSYGSDARRPGRPVVQDEGAAIRGHGGTTCDPRAIASGRPRSRTGSHGHSTVAGTKGPIRHLRWSEH